MAVLRESGRTSYPQAVALALATLADHGIATEWVWLLHDDSNPAPDALEVLLGATAIRPDADFIGPKLREWPSLKRLLEIGVTISGTGRRETGLERGEYDQGQHDNIREVLAVNSAGLLARREALEALGGYDEHLPMFGNDIDLGWRAAAAGYTTIVVPQAVVFHAEAAHRGIRRTPLTGRHTHYQERRAALFTLLANCRTAALPFQAVRLALGSLLRMVGFLVVRSVGEALDELAAVVSVYSRPGPLLAARKERRQRQVAPPDHDRVRRLLAPWWLPYRHGLDFVSDLVAAATNQAADVAERRRAAAAERDPSPPVARHKTDDDEDFEDTGLVARFLTNPAAVALAVTAIAFVIGARDAFGAVSGGALSPVPDGAGAWWSLQYESWHPIGLGSAVPAPPYVLPLALLASVLGTQNTMTFLLVAAAPVALFGAWRYLRVVGRLISRYGAPRWLLLWGSVSYALVPLVAGAWGSGRWGVVVAAAVLPWLAHAALGFAEPEATRRWRAAWRTGLLLALVSAVAPVMWWLCAVLGAVVVATSAVVVRGAIRDRSVWGPPAVALGVPAVLLAPWWLPARGGGRRWRAVPRRRPLADTVHRWTRRPRRPLRRPRRALVARPGPPRARPARAPAAGDPDRRGAVLAGRSGRCGRRGAARSDDDRPDGLRDPAARSRRGAARRPRCLDHRRDPRWPGADRALSVTGRAAAGRAGRDRAGRRGRRGGAGRRARVVRRLGRRRAPVGPRERHPRLHGAGGREVARVRDPRDPRQRRARPHLPGRAGRRARPSARTRSPP